MGTSTQQKNELFRTIWKVADELRGSVEGWDFKQYILGTLFYRYISENITNYINRLQHEAGLTDFDYAKMSDDAADEAKDEMVREKGFFIYPSQLFCNVVANADKDPDLNETLRDIFTAIEGTAVGTASEADFKGLFDDMDINSAKLGNTVEKRNQKMVKVLNAIAGMQLEAPDGNDIDAFGDAYEFLIGMYAANAGKSGGEFFTPQEVSDLLAKITLVGKKEIRKVYDPACGSGSLLLQVVENIGKENIRTGIFGQEINLVSHRLARINCFLHDINYEKFDVALGDTLLDPKHWDDEPFDVIVSNPPYSIKWPGKDQVTLINDPRFSPAGVLAPSSKADLAFTMHMLAWLAGDGTAAIVEFPGVLYRGGAEQKIRQYLVDNNFVDTVIQLPDNLFFGTSIATCIIVLKRNKADDRVLFINASKEFVHEGNKNKLAPENVKAIVDEYKDRAEKAHFAKLVEKSVVADNGYNLSVSTYVEEEDKREKVDIKALNAEIQDIVAREDKLRKAIDIIIQDMEG